MDEESAMGTVDEELYIARMITGLAFDLGLKLGLG